MYIKFEIEMRRCNEQKKNYIQLNRFLFISMAFYFLPI